MKSIYACSTREPKWAIFRVLRYVISDSGKYSGFGYPDIRIPVEITRIHQYLDDWLIRSQSQEEAQVNTQAVVDLTQSLGWIINQEKSELKPTQVFSFMGYE